MPLNIQKYIQYSQINWVLDNELCNIISYQLTNLKFGFVLA